MISGIDISRYQGFIDWVKVAAAGYKFAIIRCSVGNYYIDPTFESNWDGARAAGLQVGAYHVVRADNSAESQVLKLRGVLDGNDPKLIVLDAEVTPTGMSQAAIERAHYWMVRRTREFYVPRGTEVWIYTAAYWWNPNIGQQQWVVEDGYPLWVAAYGDNNFQGDNQPDWAEVPTKLIPIGWTTYEAHQFMSRGRVPGIIGNVDLDTMRENSFVRVWGQAAPPPPAPPVEKLPIEMRVPTGKTTVTIIEV